MTQSKSAKRKRNAQVNVPQKHIKTAKTASAINSFANDEPFEIKRLETVISAEELDITIETLMTLAQHPSLTKSKLCRNLRTAVYDFRQSCTTGINATTEGSNLTARVSAALADEKYLETKILLAEMRLRGEEPKLGALCRWVRDLDVVTQPKSISIDNSKRSAKDDELLTVLDAVMRVSCPVDVNMGTMTSPGSSSHIAFQTTWDLRPSTKPHRVYDSVLDKSIFSSAPSSVASSLRVIETTPGHLRNPPNHHPAILYTSQPHTVSLSSECPPIAYHKHPNVANLSLATNVLSPAECKAIIAVGETVGFLPDTPIREGGDMSVLAHNFYWIVDTAFHDRLWSRISPFVPASINGRLSRGLNRRFRVYRYVPGAEYRCHIDGAWPPSGIRSDDTYVYDDSPAGKKQSSLFTFLLYLNDEFEGGETTFFIPAPLEGTLNAYRVRPVMGGVAIFPHGETHGALLHEGSSVTRGAKYIIRTDIEYDIDPSEIK
ncbi:prolyl 4-hydroxylase, alpha subunit [Trichoderma arundinaceum]|uniref:Prolyl 4-hydroxylase, alpha subunit n=1 Tax=Trichoderma arundinaceum TaxID=490622 RepID=A0A395NVH3_TRIAR|nr:prolyl 4-hydroxylase, alpha subunit [Trichoderma arundinaceum]